MPRGRIGWLVACVATVVLSAGVNASAQTAGGGFGAAPAHPDPADPATRAYFKATVAPGGTYSDEVMLSSTSDAPVQLLIAPVDGLTGQTSGAVYANRQDAIHKTGAWVTPAVTAVSLAPHSQQLVAFTVKVPSDAVPGDHLAGIAVEDANPKSSGGQFGVTEVLRTVVGVDILVPGPAAPGLHVGKLGLKALPGTSVASLTIQLGDDGRKLVKPALSVSLQGPGGYRRTIDRQLDTILPGDTIDYPFIWPDTLSSGTYHVTVHATGGPSALSVQADLQLGKALVGSEHQNDRSTSSFPQLWQILLAIALGVIILLFVGWRWRRRRARRVVGVPAVARDAKSSAPAASNGNGDSHGSEHQPEAPAPPVLGTPTPAAPAPTAPMPTAPTPNVEHDEPAPIKWSSDAPTR